MAETPEGRVKRWLYGTTQKPGVLFKYFPDAYVYKPPGGMFGQGGAPDCFLVWRGVFVGLEVKAEGNEPSALQLKRLRHIIRQGGVGAVITGKDEVRLQQIYRAVMAKVERYESPGPI
jgi:hypothetical protein